MAIKSAADKVALVIPADAPEFYANFAQVFVTEWDFLVVFGSTHLETDEMKTLQPAARADVLLPQSVPLTNRQVELEQGQPQTPDDWVRGHLRDLVRFEGRWLAVASDGIVAAGESLLEVRAAADAAGRGRAEVIVFKIPRDQTKKAVTTKRS